MRGVASLLIAAAMSGAGLPGAASSQADAGLAPPLPYESAATTRERPTFAFATEKAVALLDLPPLHRVTLPEGIEELRVWGGFGLAVPHRLLRLTRRESGVQGELVLWRELREHPVSASVFQPFVAEMRRVAGRRGCGEGNIGTRWVSHGAHGRRSGRGWVFACRVDYVAAPSDWSALRTRLHELGIHELPDPSTLPQMQVSVVDGVSLEVEILAGSHYRSYTYRAPYLQAGPKAEVADRILDLVQTLDLTAAPP